MAKKVSRDLEDSGERLVPEYHPVGLIYAEHLLRYQATEAFVRGKVVLDIACGSGYGSLLMADWAKQVIGVDNHGPSIGYAKRKYASSNVKYLVGDAIKIPLEDGSVDVVVSFETLEHIKNYRKFIKEIKRVLKADGLAIISTPNDLEFAEGNEFHEHEFKYSELVSLLRKDFTYLDSYYQATWNYVALGPQKLFTTTPEMAVKTTLNLSPLKPEQYLYFYLVCSNQKITQKLESIAATAEHHSERKLVGAYYSTKQELDRRQSRINELEVEVNTNQATYQHAAKELELIKSSQAYALLRKLGGIRQKARSLPKRGKSR